MSNMMPRISSSPRFGKAAGAVASKIKDFREDRQGAIIVIIALTLTVMIGGSALAVDIGNWYHSKRLAQTAADAAAYAGAVDLARQGLGNPDGTTIALAGADAADRNDFDGAVTINYPPLQGEAVGDATAVEAVATVQPDLFLAALFLTEAPQIGARAVARATVSEACIWALHPTASGAFKVSGSAQVDFDCGVVVNSNDPSGALQQSGNSCLTATSVAVAGGTTTGCTTPAPEAYTAHYEDPLADKLSPPAEADDPCDFNSKVTVQPGDVETLLPGVYCAGMDIRGEATFSAGLYVLRGGTFKINSQAIVTNTTNGFGGVTFYLTGSGNNYAEVDISGGADVTLTPMTSGPLADVLFYQDPGAPEGGTNKFNGGSAMDLTGILYFPKSGVTFTGGTSADKAEVAIVALTLEFGGNAVVDSTFASSLFGDEFFARLVE